MNFFKAQQSTSHTIKVIIVLGNSCFSCIYVYELSCDLDLPFMDHKKKSTQAVA